MRSMFKNQKFQINILCSFDFQIFNVTIKKSHMKSCKLPDGHGCVHLRVDLI